MTTAQARRSKTFRERHPDRLTAWRRTYWLKRNYGITDADFDRMFDEQDGRCAICGTDEPGGGYNTLHVDHNHETGFVRGLLCNNCNRGLGMFSDDAWRLEAATAYLLREWV